MGLSRKPVVMLSDGTRGELPAGDVLSVTRSGRGTFTGLVGAGVVNVTVTWAVPFPDANYEVVATVQTASAIVTDVSVVSLTAAGCVVRVFNLSGQGLLGFLTGTTIGGTVFAVAHRNP